MHYEINVTHNNMHFFATAKRSCRDIHKATDVFNTLKRRFPESEGFHITITRWETLGTRISLGDDHDR